MPMPSVSLCAEVAASSWQVLGLRGGVAVLGEVGLRQASLFVGAHCEGQRCLGEWDMKPAYGVLSVFLLRRASRPVQVRRGCDGFKMCPSVL